MFLKKKPGNNPVTRAAYGGCLRKPQGGAGPRLRHRTGSPLVGRRPTNGRLMADQWRTALRPPIDFLARERLHKLIIVNLHKLCKYGLGVLDTNLFGRGSSRQEVAGDRESSDRANNRVDRLILTEFFLPSFATGPLEAAPEGRASFRRRHPVWWWWWWWFF